MLITKLTTSTDLYQTQAADIATITSEVRQNGYYSAFCTDVIDVPCHDDLMRTIKTMAKDAHLKVSFNAAESICVFEAGEKF